MKKPPKYVYLLSTESYGHNGFIKVGVTCDYKKRIKQIDNTTPFPISAILIAECDDPLYIESKVLKKFKANRIKGEWFYVKPSLDIDCTKCTHKDFMRDFMRQSRLLEAEMSNYLKKVSTKVVLNALL